MIIIMSISQRDVEHIANLARIELTKEEEEKMEKELSAILDFIGKLNEADTSNVEPMTGGTDLTNVTRLDKEEKPLGGAESLVGASPKKEKGFIEVKSVF